MTHKPKRRGNPRVERKPKARRAPPVPDAQMSWRFEHADLDGPWGWKALQDDDSRRLHGELVELEQATRRKLQAENKLIPIPSEDLCPEAQKRLLDLKLEEWEELWQLVLRSGTKAKWRAWGRADGSHFYLLWWDPRHTVCPRGPAKGTAKHR